MLNLAVKIAEIKRELADIPESRLAEVDRYLKTILKTKKLKKTREPKTLGGIWANKGFEKITSIEKEIQASRKELGAMILHKKL